MEVEEFNIDVTAFKSEEEYKDFIDVSNKIDAFCTQAKILETVAKSNKYVEATLDFCGKKGEIQNSVKIFSPVLDDANGEREIFAAIGSKVVRLGVETAFESGGTKLAQSIGAAVIVAGAGTPPAWIMGTATGGSIYLGGKYIGIAVGHYVEKYSNDKFLEFYDKYLEQNQKELKQNLEVVDTENNEKTVFEPNKEINQVEPVAKVDLTTQDIIPLKENQTISHIAQLTGKSTIDLAEYNNITMEEAKSLPVGTPIRTYKGDPEIINTPDGNIKLFENHDGTETAILPEGIAGEKTTINFDSDNSTVLYGDRTNPEKITYVDDVTNNYIEITKDSNGSYYKAKELNNENLLLNTLFFPISALSQKKYSSFTLVNSNTLFFQSLELEKNRVFNYRFDFKKVA